MSSTQVPSQNRQFTSDEPERPHFGVSLEHDVTISVQGGVAYVRPSRTELLHPILTYEEMAFRRTASGHLQHAVETKRCYECVEDRLTIPVGCIPRVVRHLAQSGLNARVERCQNRYGHPWVIDERYLADAESLFPRLASILANEITGVLEVHDGNRQINLLGTMCQLFHSARIFIAVKTIEATRTIAAGLGRFLGGEVEAVHGWNWHSSCRVVCGTFGSLDRSDPADWQIVIFADAFEGIQNANNNVRAAFGHRRLYALVDPRKRCSPRDQLLFETLAGPVIFRDPDIRQTRPSALLAAFATHASSGSRFLDNARDRRVALWHDSRRNQAVAEIASALSQGDDSALCEHGLFLEGEHGLASIGSAPGVMIIVDSVEHGEQLHSLLRDWHFFHRGINQNPSAVGRTAGAIHWGVPQNSIVTAVAADKLCLTHCRILIWASGGCIPFIPTAIGHSTLSHLLVDFWDDNNCQLASDTQQRLHAYRSIGCHLLGSNLERREQALVQAIDSDQQGRHQNTSRRRRRP